MIYKENNQIETELLLKIFKSGLPKDFDFDNLEVYFITAFELSLGYLRLFELKFKKNDFFEIFKKLRYDPLHNNIIVFYLEWPHKEGEFFLISDSSGINGKEFVLKNYKYNISENEYINPHFMRII
jgi:hypothetical protein